MSDPDLPIRLGNSGTPHRSGVVSHVAGEDERKIKAAQEVVERLGKT